MEKEKTFQIRLTAELFKKSAENAKKKGISLAGLIRFLLIKEIDRSDKK